MANSNNGAPSNQRGARQGAESVVYVLLAVVVLVLANVAGNFIHFRSDWTEANRYSLSQGSENLVSDLDDEMTITAYFTSDLPQPFNTIEPYVRNILDEYAAASSNVTVTFIDPDEDEEKEEAQENGVQELRHPGIENDSRTIKLGFRGIVIWYKGNRETIPIVQDTSGLEYEISQAIRRLVREPLPVGVVSGHGSPTTAEGLATLTGELENYELREVDLSSDVDDALRALLIVNPTEAFTEAELRRVNAYVMNGGSLGVFGGTRNISLEGAAPSGASVDTGLNTLLQGWGVEMSDSLVADARCGQVPLRTPIGNLPVAYPPAPIIMVDEQQRQHPVLFRLNQVPFFWPAKLTTTSRFDELNGVVLGRSGADSSWLLTGDSIALQPRDPREWQIGAQTGPHSVLLALSGELPSAFTTPGEGEAAIEANETSAREVRVLVSGSGSALRDQFLQSRAQARGQMTAGLAFALNAVDWLAADSDLIAIRAKNIEDPMIDVPQDVRQAQEEFRAAITTAAETGDETGIEEAVEEHDAAMETWESKKALYRWGLGLGIPLFVILFGLIRRAVRRNQQDRLRALRKSLVAKKG